MQFEIGTAGPSNHYVCSVYCQFQTRKTPETIVAVFFSQGWGLSDKLSGLETLEKSDLVERPLELEKRKEHLAILQRI